MSLWANIKFFPEPTGELYGWLLATLVVASRPTIFENGGRYCFGFGRRLRRLRRLSRLRRLRGCFALYLGCY